MSKIRIFSLFVVLCILLVSAMGCGITPSGNTTPTAPAGTSSGSPAVAEPEATPSPVAADIWRPVAEEDLSEQDLDAWMDMRYMMLGYGSLQDMRAHLAAYCPAVAVEVADAMAWAYCDALRKYADTTLRRKLTQEGRQAFLDSIEGTEIGWIEPEGMLESRIRYDKLADFLTSCSPVFREYLRLMAMDDTSMPAEDGALMIGFDELADRTLACEDFFIKAQGTPFQGAIEDLYVGYLYLLLSGAHYPSVFNMDMENEALALNPDAEEAFRYVLDTAPESRTASAIADWRTWLHDIVESGAAKEAAYQQLWDGFSARVAQYASEAGVRFPQVYMAVRDELTDTGMGENAMGKMEYPILYGDGVDADTLTGLTEWMEGDISDTVQGIPSPFSVLRLARGAGPVTSVVADFGSTARDYSSRRGYNFDPVTGEHLQLEDLFNPDTDPWTLLAQDVDRQITLLQDRVDEVEPGKSVTGDNYAGITGNQQWYATDEGIAVIFGNGEIYPFGAAELTVPWHRLADYLAD